MFNLFQFSVRQGWGRVSLPSLLREQLSRTLKDVLRKFQNSKYNQTPMKSVPLDNAKFCKIKAARFLSCR